MSRTFNLLCIFYLFSITSCADTSKEAEVQEFSYFDIKGYFEKEVAKLSVENPLVYKEVYKNRQKEAKEVAINDWQKELSLFIESDINKPSWKNSYSFERSDDTVIYRALEDELRTRKIEIIKIGEKVLSIYIENSASNELYKSNEQLFYFPDSLYRIIKKQQVRILGENQYEIVGKLKKAN